jgi:hypothetical protein
VTEPRPGDEVAGFRLEEVIGRGGMGIVYRARQLRLDRTVALKVIAPQLASDAGFRARFESESRLAASIQHPNVVTVYQADEVDGLLFLAMQYVPGVDLKSVIATSPGGMDVNRAVGIVEQVAAALDAAHAAGLVHRDVKPANVLVVEEGPYEKAYLSDFGLTKQLGGAAGMTATGQLVGTLAYIAPEQLRAEPLDARTDVYALGCVLFEALTGRAPFDRDSDAALIFSHLSDPPPRATELRDGLPAAFDDVCTRALAKSPDDRYASAGDLATAARAAMSAAPADDGPTLLGPPPTPAAPEAATVPWSPAVAVASAQPGDSGPVPSRGKRPLAIVLLAIVALIGVAGIAAIVIAAGGSGGGGGGGDDGGSGGGGGQGSGKDPGATSGPSVVESSTPSAPVSGPAIPAAADKNLASAANAAGCTVSSFAEEGREHSANPADWVYDANPPTSGTHAPTWAQDGVYPFGSAPNKGLTTHALEHGRIDIQYGPSLTQGEFDQLQTLMAEDEGYHQLLFKNQTKMPFAVAATSWTQQLGCKAMNPKVFDAIRAFKARYTDQAPENVP